MTTIAFYKPFNVVCQFSGEGETLSSFGLPPKVYAAGRLDKDSEGLLILTDDGAFNQRITHPKMEKSKIYHIQVEGIPSEASLSKMQKGLLIQDYITKPCQVKLIADPGHPPRNPPIRERKNIPTSWLEVILTEGKNRQVRRMSAAIGHPTLRLIRYQVGKLELKNLSPGQWHEVNPKDIL